jgi:hypothetical protein
MMDSRTIDRIELAIVGVLTVAYALALIGNWMRL